MKMATDEHEERENSADRIEVSDADQSEWLTAQEAASYAGRLGVSTVRDACNRKELRHVRVGGRARGPIRTRREWVDEWLEGWARGGEVA
jgi:excisionase family DNA binding protein